MNEQSEYESLINLIKDVEMALLKREMCFNTANAWKCELSLHPDRFVMNDNELLWLGCRVCTIGSEQNQNKFWRMVNKYLSDGVIRKG